MIGAILGLAGSLIGGSMQASAARRAASAQERAADRQIDYAEDTRNLVREDLAPWRDVGQNALNALSYEIGQGARPADYRGFEATPGYEFRRNEGLRAIDGTAAARGGLFSGATMRSAQRYGDGLASAEYGNHINRLSGLAGSGQNAASGQAQALTNANQFVNTALGAQGNATAAGHIGAANAWSGAIQNGIGMYGYMNALNGGQNPFAQAGPNTAGGNAAGGTVGGSPGHWWS